MWIKSARNEEIRVSFQKNGYPNLFINDTIKKFKKLKANTKKEKCEKDFVFTIGLP